jgi:hypothetical protein
LECAVNKSLIQVKNQDFPIQWEVGIDKGDAPDGAGWAAGKTTEAGKI